MGTSRTSNKDILDAILGLTAAITQSNTQAHAPVQVAAPVETPAATQEPESTDSIKLPASYREHVMAKVQSKVNSDGTDRILYARRNLQGEVKLAYCVADRWTSLKDKGLIGAIAHVKPE